MHDHDEQLNDTELDAALHAWNAPVAPAALRRRVLSAREPRRWRDFFTGSIRVPVPVAVALVVLIAAGLVVTVRLRPRVITRVVYREVAVPLSSIGFQGLQPVDELRPRIIRRGDAKN